MFIKFIEVIKSIFTPTYSCDYKRFLETEYKQSKYDFDNQRRKDEIRILMCGLSRG